MVDYESDITSNSLLACCCNLLEATAINIAVGIIFVGSNAFIEVACQVEIVYLATNHIDGAMTRGVLGICVDMCTRCKCRYVHMTTNDDVIDMVISGIFRLCSFSILIVNTTI